MKQSADDDLTAFSGTCADEAIIFVWRIAQSWSRDFVFVKTFRPAYLSLKRQYIIHRHTHIYIYTLILMYRVRVVTCAAVVFLWRKRCAAGKSMVYMSLLLDEPSVCGIDFSNTLQGHTCF